MDALKHIDNGRELQNALTLLKGAEIVFANYTSTWCFVPRINHIPLVPDSESCIMQKPRLHSCACVWYVWSTPVNGFYRRPVWNRFVLWAKIAWTLQKYVNTNLLWTDRAAIVTTHSLDLLYSMLNSNFINNIYDRQCINSITQSI